MSHGSRALGLQVGGGGAQARPPEPVRNHEQHPEDLLWRPIHSGLHAPLTDILGIILYLRYFGYLPSNAGKGRAMQSSSLANSLRAQPTVHVQHTLLPNREGIVIGGWKITSKKVDPCSCA